MRQSASRDVRDPLANVDVVVVGGGSAGLSAVKILARSRRSVLVIDAGAPRNAPAQGVHNYLYAEETPPGRLAEIGRTEAEAYGVKVREATATAATVVAQPKPGGPRFTVTLAGGDGATRTVGARRVVLATGLLDVLPDVDGMAERWSRDVLHCPFCHGWEVRDQAIGVLGTNPMALHQVLLFRQLTDDVVYFQHTAPDPTDAQVEQLTALGVEWVVGEVTALQTTGDVLSGVRMVDGRIVARQAVAVATGLEAREDLLADLGLATTELELGGFVAGHYLPADPTGRTATPGVWTAGNVTAPMAQVITSAAAGSGVGAAIHLDLIGEDTDLAVGAMRARRVRRSRAGSMPGEAVKISKDCAWPGPVRLSQDRLDHAGRALRGQPDQRVRIPGQRPRARRPADPARRHPGPGGQRLRRARRHRQRHGPPRRPQARPGLDAGAARDLPAATSALVGLRF